MDFISDLNKQVVSQKELQDHSAAILQACSKQIKSEVDEFVNSSLYRAVKSIIKAELDVLETKKSADMDKGLEKI